MRNILLSVVVVAALVVAGIGGTLADWVEDDHGSYCLTAGYLNLRVDIDGNWIMEGPYTADQDPEGVGVPMAYYADDLGELICESGIEPGDSDETTLSFHIYGDTSITGAKVTVSGTIESLENTVVEPEITAGDRTFGAGPDQGELDDFMQIMIWLELDGDNTYEDGEVLLYEGSWAGLIACLENDPSQLEFELVKCVTYYVGFAWELPGYDEEPDVNQCMTDSIGGTVTFTAEAIHAPTQPNPPITP
ncbi:MAG: hypothetical protein JSW16_00020 [Dehalococcoidales bacterium]|nr:MAG: hypothetical protein JSW16_00020 [Dehalococcoidales bacterium]